MQELKINKHIYDTMILHYGDKLTQIAQEFNDYLTVQNIIDDYQYIDNMIEFRPSSLNKTVSLVITINSEVKKKLQCDEVINLNPDFDYWYHSGEEPTIMFSRYFQLFIVRKIDYYGFNIIQKEMQGDWPDNGIHPHRLALEADGSQRSVVALMLVLLNGCSASEQKRILTFLQFNLDCLFSENQEVSMIVDLLVQSKYYRL